MQFSPDEQYLAVRKDFDLTILTVPDLEILVLEDVSLHEVVLEGSLKWSQDSQLLATQGTGDLVIWEAESGEFFRHPLDNTHGPIYPLVDGWLVATEVIVGEQVSRKAFSFCTRYAEDCTAYHIAELRRPSYHPSCVGIP